MSFDEILKTAVKEAVAEALREFASPPTDGPAQMNIKKLSAAYGMPERTIREWIYNDPTFPAFKIGQVWYIPIQEFLQWQEKFRNGRKITMTNKEIFAKVHTILQLAMEISTTTVADVFVNYHPNANSVLVDIYKHGYHAGEWDRRFYDIYFERPNGWYRDKKHYCPSLDEIIAELEALKASAEKLPESEVKPDEHS